VGPGSTADALRGLGAHREGPRRRRAHLLLGRVAVLDGARCRPRYETVDWSGDLAFTVGYEDTEVRIDAGPPVCMTLRVTHILRRVDGEWRLVHRHADFPPEDPRG